MKKVIVFGSLNMDLSIQCPVIPSQGETIEGHAFFRAAGGKGGNQAVAAAKLGAKTYMLGKIAADAFGRELEQSLKDAGVQCDYVLRNGSSTGVAFILRNDGDNRIICDYGANLQMTMEETAPALSQLALPGDLFLTQLECSPEVTFSLLHTAKKIGMTTVFNPAPAQALPIDLYPSLDYIIINQTECRILTGIFPHKREDCEEPLRMLQDRGTRVPFITLGKEGSVCKAGDTFYAVPSFKVGAVDTTAAGDAFIGAFASSLARGEEIRDAMIFATKAAAMTITRSGAQKAIPSLTELNQFTLKEVHA